MWPVWAECALHECEQVTRLPTSFWLMSCAAETGLVRRLLAKDCVWDGESGEGEGGKPMPD